jgi:hypothetical protein
VNSQLVSVMMAPVTANSPFAPILNPKHPKPFFFGEWILNLKKWHSDHSPLASFNHEQKEKLIRGVILLLLLTPYGLQ